LIVANPNDKHLKSPVGVQKGQNAHLIISRDNNNAKAFSWKKGVVGSRLGKFKSLEKVTRSIGHSVHPTTAGV